MSITLDGTNGITTPDVDTDGLTVDTNTLFVDAANNRVGVGTSSPSLKLSVDGDIWQGNGAGTEIGRITNAAGWYDFGGSNNVNGAQMSHGAILRFLTNSAERLRIDSAGNVGIGTTAPQSDLEIQSKTTGTDAVISLTAAGTRRYQIKALTSVAALAFVDESLASERARIDASGNLLVGTTTSGGDGLSIQPRVSSGGTTQITFNRSSATQTGDAVAFNNGGTRVGTITYNNTTTAYLTSSDYRLKEDVQPMVGSVDRLMALKPVNFAWKVDGSRVDGFLAHEAQEVVPECVTGEKDQVQIVELKDEDGNVTGAEERPVYQGIDQSKIVPLLVAALQEALTKIEALEARVAALETNA
jgi:hypothetical protein